MSAPETAAQTQNQPHLWYDLDWRCGFSDLMSRRMPMGGSVPNGVGGLRNLDTAPRVCDEFRVCFRRWLDVGAPPYTGRSVPDIA
eukprot:867780-Rhodomonas_salina.1